MTDSKQRQGQSTWDAIEPLLDELLELDPNAQSEYLDTLDGQDAALAKQLADLLAADEPDEEIRVRLDPLMEEALEALDGRDSIEDRLGPWELHEEIGRGGMGLVFRAQRADGQYQQTVALKVMTERIGDRLARRRFLNERQILARLAHPNVAQLVDGGVLEDGRPYFAMELVRGAPILDFAAEQRLSIDARLELLLQLCRGIEYAHRNLIIHRDIKPSNVLVTRTTFVGQGSGGETGAEDDLHLVKLLDFGIAKMTDPENTTTLQTQGGFRPMTFEYASPEQIRGDDVTIASDLYSLALIGYELIIGVPPFEVRAESLSSIARVAERNNAAPRLSTRYGSFDQATQAEVAQQRQATPAALLKVLRSDLDHIFALSLRKLPENRYESVAALRRDLERFLEGLPVRARRGSTKYRLQKLVSRNRVAAIAACAVLMASIAGVIGIVWQAREASKERDRAVVAEARSRAINRFLLDDVLGAAAPENARGQEITVSEALDASALRLRQQFAEQPDLDAEITGTIGDVYLRLGRPEQAETHLRASLEAAKTARSPELVGAAQRRLARLASTRGNPAEEIRFLENAIDELSSSTGDDSLVTLMAQAELARARTLTDERSAALDDQERAVATIERLHPAAWRERLQVMSALTSTYVDVRRAQDAEALATRTLALQREHLGDDHPDLVPTLQQLASAQLREHRPEDALRNLEQAANLVRKLKGNSAPDLIEIGRLQINTLRALSRHEEALPIAARTLEAARELENGEGLLTAELLNSSGVLRSDLGRLAGALGYYRQSAELLLRLVGESNASYLRALRNIASTWEKRRQTDPVIGEKGYAQAIQILLDTERGVVESNPLDPTLLADISNDFVWRQRSRADVEYALELAQRAVDDSDRQNWEALQSLGRAHTALGNEEEAMIRNLEALALPGALKSIGLERDIPTLYERLGQAEEVLPLLESILRRRISELPADDPSIGFTQLWLARYSRTYATHSEAETWYRKSIDQLELTKPARYHRLLAARSELGELLLDKGDARQAEALILSAFQTMLDRSYLDRELQEALTQRAIRMHRESARNKDAIELAAKLERWRTQSINSAWSL